MESKNQHTFKWVVESKDPKMLRSFLKEKGISKRLLAKIKFQGGDLKVNGQSVNVLETLKDTDRIEVHMPKEKDNAFLVPSFEELTILFEDHHYIVVNKPAGIAAVPSPTHKKSTMANRIKGYMLMNTDDPVTVHAVTRLDRNTSGAMIFAKHPFAHAQLDKQLRKKEVNKEYLAVVEGEIPGEGHGFIDRPIARSEDSIITRRVHSSGKEALTEYWVLEKTKEYTLMDVKIHTGRTHQIRVHFASLGFPLVGDELYGGTLEDKMSRQALHCASVSFYNPFSNQMVTVDAPLPKDLEEYVKVF